MSTTIQDTTLTAWTSGRKTFKNTKGWISGNACCCIHNGETVDTRGRGGMIVNDDTISYFCFNCNFKAAYTKGYPLSYKFRKLLKWLNVSDNEIYRLNLEALREQQRQELLGLVKIPVKKEDIVTNFAKFELPEGAHSFMHLISHYELADQHYPRDFVDVAEYVGGNRRINLQKYDFYWTPNKQSKMNERVIVPFTWNNEVIGYSARAINDDIKPKYVSRHDNGYVFNLDKQKPNWKFVIVCEGVFDALSIDGVAVLKSDVTKLQVDLIESLDREIIVVPDWNRTGQKLIDVALKNGWSVSFPVWAETCVDINEAVKKYGKLFVLKTIIDSVEHSELKIKLLRKKYVTG